MPFRYPGRSARSVRLRSHNFLRFCPEHLLQSRHPRRHAACDGTFYVFRKMVVCFDTKFLYHIRNGTSLNFTHGILHLSFLAILSYRSSNGFSARKACPGTVFLPRATLFRGYCILQVSLSCIIRQKLRRYHTGVNACLF